MDKVFSNFAQDSKRDLSSKAHLEIAQMCGPRPFRWVIQMMMAWAVIIISVVVAELSGSWFVMVLAMIVIATRQNILGLLIHEQSHCLGFKARVGDLIANIFCAYPLLVLTIEGYSNVHLIHHKYFFNEEKDFDLIRKKGPDWKFPMRIRSFLKMFAIDLMGLNLFTLILGKNKKSMNDSFNRTQVRFKWIKPMFYGLLILALAMFNGWHIILLYWITPLLSFLQVIVRWGAICEHRYSKELNLEESTPLIFMKPWEKLILPNLNFNYHIYHHYFPGVSFYLLPKIHEIFIREGLVSLNGSYQSSFAFACSLIDHPIFLKKKHLKVNDICESVNPL